MADSTKHILTSFDKSLSALRTDVLTMAKLTNSSLRSAIDGLFLEDDALCNKAIAEDEEIDQLEKEIDRIGIEILTRFHPLASDLRSVVSAMRVSNNLERVADQAVSIAKKARKLSGPADAETRDLLQPMFDAAIALLNDSVRAFHSGDVDLATSLKARDKQVDEFNRRTLEYLTEQMMKVPEKVTDFMNLIFIARHIERVGDHAKNIAEDAVYAAAAEDIRHIHAPKT